MGKRLDQLTRAARALHEGDYDTALSALLHAWGETHAPDLAAVIDEVSARVTAQLPLVAHRLQRKALTDWVELARLRRPSDVGRLLAALLEVLALGPPHVVQPRLDELLQLPPDPRVAAALLEALAAPAPETRRPQDLTHPGWSDATYKRAVKVLLRHGAAHLTERLDSAILARSATHFFGAADRDRFEKVRGAWGKRVAKPVPPGLDDVRSALAVAPAPAAPAMPPADRVDGDALLAAIYADPWDEGRRLVYADHLSAQGDPRGELIVLQVDRAQGRGSDEKTRREKALLKAHGSKWLGGLANEIVIAYTQWEAGFPVQAWTKMPRLSQLEASVLRREWATFRRVHFTGAALVGEGMRSLEEAYGLTDTAVLRMAKLPTPPQHLHTVEVDLGHRTLAVDEPAIAAVLALPALRTLVLRWTAHAEPILGGLPGARDEATPQTTTAFCDIVGERLEHLSLTGGVFSRGEMLAPFLEGGGGRALRSITWGQAAWKGWRRDVTALRDASGRWTTIELRNDWANTHGRASIPMNPFLEALGPHRFELARVRGGPAEEELAAVVARRVEKLGP